MPLPPKTDHAISRPDAARAIRRRQDAERAAPPDGATAARPAPQPTAYGFHAEAFHRILRQPGCVGIRAYPALKDDGRPTLVLVGFDAEGRELADGELSEFAFDCPPFCPPDGFLVDAG